MMATRDAYGKALLQLGEENKDIVVLDADLSGSTRTSKFAARFPDRFFNFGVAEANMVGYAAGLAICGKIPFVSTFAIFAACRAFEQIRNSVCWPNLNVKIVVTHAGISVGEDGASHQAIEDISIARMIPNMTVVVPCDGIEAGKAVVAASKTKGPFYIRLGRASFPVVFSPDYKFELGKAKIIKEGKDATIIACGLMVFEALGAREILKEKGLDVRVINMSTIKPIDKEAIICAARETRAILTAEEHTIIGGLGSAVAEVLAENMPTLIRRIGVQDVFGISGSPGDLMRHFKLTKEDIARTVLELKET